ncbi:hypothetical protein LTR73_006898 [Friedmanniomyces endolithicus]|nr:hypothetical protein LTR73_006898 [Friedmanniomyces endolithicus]
MADTPAEDLTNPTAPADLTTKLDHLKAAATQQYSLKNYTAAAESFSEAAELQDQLNGEMSLENVDLLYQYGRCLYHVAISNSDVLGGKVASAEEPKRKKRKVGKSESGADALGGAGVVGDALKGGEQKLGEDEAVAVTEEEKDGMLVDEPVPATAKPFFQITGDENWTDSEADDDDDDAQADGEADAEEEEDDFAIAYEILDTARILLSRKLEAAQETAGKGTIPSPETRQLKERLADTHDLQAEISLENERFQDAIQDTRDALALKLDLYPQESSLIAEAHFKLSLALEFASVTSTADAGGDAEAGGDGVAQVDEGMRKESAAEMEKAIASCRLRISKEEEACTAESDAAKADERRKAVAEVKEMVADMEQRLRDLRNPAVSMSGVSGVLAGSGVEGGGSDSLRGVLGAMLGESGVEQRKRVAEATEKANDLTGLVKHRKKKGVVEGREAGGAAEAAHGKGKRKAEEVDGDGGGGATNGKKAKVENAGSGTCKTAFITLRCDEWLDLHHSSSFAFIFDGTFVKSSEVMIPSQNGSNSVDILDEYSRDCLLAVATIVHPATLLTEPRSRTLPGDLESIIHQ